MHLKCNYMGCSIYVIAFVACRAQLGFEPARNSYPQTSRQFWLMYKISMTVLQRERHFKEKLDSWLHALS